jgi:hypothetical protein
MHFHSSSKIKALGKPADLLSNIKQAEAFVSDTAISPTGTLRVTSSQSFICDISLR